MTSRLLDSLDQRIAAAKDTVDGDCLRARKALHHVRMGQSDLAKDVLLALRCKYEARPNARVSAWLHLVEGLSCIYLGSAGQPDDKLKRCQALATVAGDDELRALASAWGAHLAYGAYQIDELRRLLFETLRTASPDNHQALSRAKLIGAVALHLSDRYDLARLWYADVHLHATAEGDEATLSALMHNTACMCVANLRQSKLDPIASTPRYAAEPSALAGATATASFDELVGASSLTTWVPILQAQTHALQDRPAVALEIYEASLPETSGQGLDRVMGYMTADIAWCRLQLGQTTRAMEEAQIAAQSISDSTVLVDDRAATHSRLSAIFQAAGQVDMAAQHRQRAEAEWLKFRKLQALIVEQLSPLLGSG